MELFLTIIYLLICIGLIVSVLLQSGKSAGIAGSIAGGAKLYSARKGRWPAYADSLMFWPCHCNDCFY